MRYCRGSGGNMKSDCKVVIVFVLIALALAVALWMRFAQPHMTETQLLLHYWWAWLLMCIVLFFGSFWCMQDDNILYIIRGP